MKKLFLFVELCLLFAVPAAASPVLTPQEAVRLALEHSPQIQAANRRFDAARAAIDQARSDKIPHLFASLGGSWQGEDGKIPAFVRVQGAALGPLGTPIGTVVGGGAGYALDSFTEAYAAELGVQWLVFSSGAVENSVAAKKWAARGVDAQTERVRQTIAHETLACWYGLQRARAKRAVAQEIYDLAKEHLDQVNTFYRHGAVAKHDVLRTEAAVAESQLGLITVDNAVQLAWKGLERLVGISLQGCYDLPEPNGRGVAQLDEPGEDDAALRPELVALGCLKQAANASAKAAHGSLGPKLLAKGSLVAQGRQFWPNDRQDWEVGLALRWDFFDGGKASAQAREAKAKAAEADAQIEDVKRQIDMEIAQSRLNMTSAISRNKVAVQQEKSASEDYRIALVRYNAAVGTNLDVLDARAQLSKARNGVVDALYDSLLARNDYWFALGGDPLDETFMSGAWSSEKGEEHAKSHR
ncbi:MULTISPECIES: TolC family protein [Jonquetella]|uniref:Outer membrane protein n=1 Tax=Jonquetella anthropi DSM 22815 TaxID=885272 RepID=H0UM22_9BACT|nr:MULTISPECIES: TolC family protein [Jonquetella]EHM12564.1 outer membrane protein [Jonquetella anthropi DSM 22815]ERL24673.1 outer membrane efflux protein [Jonquetella sp. BV3C21]